MTLKFGSSMDNLQALYRNGYSFLEISADR